MFVTSQGSAHGRVERAIAKRQLGNALMAARELGELPLADALELCLLLAEVASERYSPAAARWHAKFALRARGLASTNRSLRSPPCASYLRSGREPSAHCITSLGVTALDQ